MNFFKFKFKNLFLNITFFISLILKMVVVLTVLCTNSIYCKLYPSNLWDFNNDLSDMSSSKNLIYGQNYEFTSDRYCKLKSAVYLKQGYLQAPPGVYFSGDFTISLWISLEHRAHQIFVGNQRV